MRLPLLMGIGWLSVALIGCSSVEESLRPAELTAIEASHDVVVQWRAPLDSSTLLRDASPARKIKHYSRPFGGGDRRTSTLASDATAIYAATRKGSVSKVEKASGKTVWQSSIEHIGGALSLSQGTVFVGTLKGEVIALSAEDGTEKWRSTVTTEVVASPASNGSQVIVSTIDGRLSALDAVSGESLWTYDHTQPLLTYRHQAAPVFHDENVIVAFDNGQLLSFIAQTGQQNWVVRISEPSGITELERAVDLDVAPIVRPPYVFAAGANGRVAAVNVVNGKLIWAEDASVFNDMTSNDTVLFVADESSHVIARAMTSGQTLWENDALHRRGLNAPAAVGDVIAVIDGEDNLHAISASSGKIVARRQLTATGYDSPMLVDADTLYALSDYGVLSAFKFMPTK